MSVPRTQPAWRDTAFGLAWVSPWIIGFLVFTLIPVAISAYLSFCQFDGLRRPVWIGFENFRTLATDPLFWKVLKNTLTYAAFALPLGALLSLTLAVLLSFGNNLPFPDHVIRFLEKCHFQFPCNMH